MSAGFLVGEGVDDLLRGPCGVGMESRVKVNDLSAVMTEYNEHIQDVERDRRNSEEVAGSDGADRALLQ
jgi:hypothetical protein